MKARFLVVAGGVVAVDQVLKVIIERTIPPGHSVPLIPRIFSITHVVNPGVAFGLLGGVPVPLVVLFTLTALLVILYNGRRWQGERARIALSMIVGGSVGNLLDRLRVGGVMDYLDLGFWPVFNLADVAVVLGAVLLAFALIGKPKQGGAV